MKQIIYLLTILNFNWAIGLQGLIIPSNSKILATAGAGIASNLYPELNPGIKPTNNSFLQYSINQWLGEIKGNNILYRWGEKYNKQLSIQTWNVDKLELRGDSPSETPIETFGAHFVSASYSMSCNLNNKSYLGFLVKTNYSHLFTESLYGITFDFGLGLSLKDYLNLGIVIRNIGYENTNTLQANLPTEFGIGTETKFAFIKTSILTDLLYTNMQSELRLGLITDWKWLNINLGSSFSKNRNANSLGFSFDYRKWKINSGIYFHENSSILGVPIFIDICHYL